MITRKGRPVAVIVSSEEWEVLEETLDILSDPETMEALRESDKDVAAGRVYSWDEVKRELGLA